MNKSNLFLVISLIFHYTTASLLETSVHQFRRELLNPAKLSSFIPTYSYDRTSRSGDDVPPQPNENSSSAETWKEIFIGKDPKTILFGGVAGWAAGFVAMKVSKVAATAITGGAVLLAIANYNDLITINWHKVNNGVQNASNSFHPEASSWSQKVSLTAYKIAGFANENKHGAAGFAVGFLLGMLSS